MNKELEQVLSSYFPPQVIDHIFPLFGDIRECSLCSSMVYDYGCIDCKELYCADCSDRVDYAHDEECALETRKKEHSKHCKHEWDGHMCYDKEIPYCKYCEDHVHKEYEIKCSYRGCNNRGHQNKNNVFVCMEHSCTHKCLTMTCKRHLVVNCTTHRHSNCRHKINVPFIYEPQIG